MTNETDRIQRANNYVLGLMSARERARAERDLERDRSFRDLVTAMAMRLRLAQNATSEERWRAISSGLSELPQMRDRKTTTPGAGRAASLMKFAPTLARSRKASTAAPRAVSIAAAIALAFVLGFAAGAATGFGGHALMSQTQQAAAH